MLLSLDEHHMAVWTIAISSTGAFLVSAGADRSLRLYERTKEPFFLDEEKEKRLDSMFEDTGIEMDEEDRKNSERLDLQNGTNDDSDAHNVTTAESGLAGRRTMETLDSADKICAAVDLAKHELERIAATENEKRQSADPSKNASAQTKSTPPQHGTPPIRVIPSQSSPAGRARTLHPLPPVPLLSLLLLDLPQILARAQRESRTVLHDDQLNRPFTLSNN